MTVKITEKDKALLIVLAIIIVVFAAVMFPNYGIKALFDQRSEIKNNTVLLATENDEKLVELINSGIPMQHAQTYWNAKDALESNILYKKYEAIKLANIIYNFGKSYSVPYDWLEDIRYLNYEKNSENLFAFISYDQSQNEEDVIVFRELILNEDGELVLGNKEVPVVLSSFELNIFEDGGNVFEYITEMSVPSADLSTFSQILLYLAQLEQKGSILIDSYTYNPEGVSNIALTIYMTSGGEMKNYSALIGECPDCNAPYYYADAVDGNYVCPECNNPIAPQ